MCLCIYVSHGLRVSESHGHFITLSHSQSWSLSWSLSYCHSQSHPCSPIHPFTHSLCVCWSNRQCVFVWLCDNVTVCDCVCGSVDVCVCGCVCLWQWMRMNENGWEGKSHMTFFVWCDRRIRGWWEMRDGWWEMMGVEWWEVMRSDRWVMDE